MIMREREIYARLRGGWSGRHRSQHAQAKLQLHARHCQPKSRLPRAPRTLNFFAYPPKIEASRQMDRPRKIRILAGVVGESSVQNLTPHELDECIGHLNNLLRTSTRARARRGGRRRIKEGSNPVSWTRARGAV